MHVTQLEWIITLGVTIAVQTGRGPIRGAASTTPR